MKKHAKSYSTSRKASSKEIQRELPPLPKSLLERGVYADESEMTPPYGNASPRSINPTAAPTPNDSEAPATPATGQGQEILQACLAGERAFVKAMAEGDPQIKRMLAAFQPSPVSEKPPQAP